MKVLVALLLVLMTAPIARAETTPTPNEIARGLAVARSYWGQLPPCGEPSVVYEEQAASFDGEALVATCQIALRPTGVDYRDSPYMTCEVLVHEYGHLVLGPTYFAATNPEDPAHSPDPNNIMYRRVPGNFAPCAEPLPTHHQRRHHRR